MIFLQYVEEVLFFIIINTSIGTSFSEFKELLGFITAAEYLRRFVLINNDILLCLGQQWQFLFRWLRGRWRCHLSYACSNCLPTTATDSSPGRRFLRFFDYYLFRFWRCKETWRSH